jgi:hypothetical protein
MMELAPWEGAFPATVAQNFTIQRVKVLHSDLIGNGHGHALKRAQSQMFKPGQAKVEFVQLMAVRQICIAPGRHAQPVRLVTAERDGGMEILGISTPTHYCVRVAQPFSFTG